jgi:hypothetical protein
MVLLEIWVGVSPPSLSSIGSEVMLIAQVLVIAVGLVYELEADVSMRVLAHQVNIRFCL